MACVGQRGDMVIGAVKNDPTTNIQCHIFVNPYNVVVCSCHRSDQLHGDVLHHEICPPRLVTQLL